MSHLVRHLVFVGVSHLSSSQVWPDLSPPPTSPGQVLRVYHAFFFFLSPPFCHKGSYTTTTIMSVVKLTVGLVSMEIQRWRLNEEKNEGWGNEGTRRLLWLPTMWNINKSGDCIAAAQTCPCIHWRHGEEIKRDFVLTRRVIKKWCAAIISQKSHIIVKKTPKRIRQRHFIWWLRDMTDTSNEVLVG